MWRILIWIPLPSVRSNLWAWIKDTRLKRFYEHCDGARCHDNFTRGQSVGRVAFLQAEMSTGAALVLCGRSCTIDKFSFLKSWHNWWFSVQLFFAVCVFLCCLEQTPTRCRWCISLHKLARFRATLQIIERKYKNMTDFCLPKLEL